MKSKLQIPVLPDFIQVGTEIKSIADFTNDELERIADAWKQGLIGGELSLMK